MELDELKEAWALVDERLKENEMLNKRIVQEMLSAKSNRSLNKLINIELFNIIILLSVIPFLIWLLNYNHFIKFVFPRILFVGCLVICIFGIIWGSYTLKRYLLKIDFSKNIKDNMYYVNKFAIYYEKGKMIGYYIVFPFVSIFCILSYYEFKAPFHLWIFLLVALTTGMVITYWIYKKVYDVNIQSIQKSMEELSELKEE